MRRLPIALGLAVVAIGLLAFWMFGGDGESDVPDATPATETSSTTTTGAASSQGSDTTTTTTSLTAAPTPPYEPAPCAFDEPAGVTVECGFVTVPEDRNDPDGTQIRLHVARFPTDAATPGDPVVYLEGGPGGEALEVVDLVFGERYAPFVEERDLIIFDQRGTGFSEPSLACDAYRQFSLDLLEQDLSTDAAKAAEIDVLQHCRAEYVDAGADIAHYNSRENAADVEAVRMALGIDRWHLYGISYGTRLALTVMRDAPDGVASAILDSTYPPEADGVADFPANARRAFDVLFAGCATDTACAAEFGDLEARLFALVDRLNGDPVTAPVIDFFTGTRYEAVINGDDLLGVVFQSLYSEQLIPSIPDLVASVEAGDTGDLGNILSLFVANGEFFSVGMYMSVQCNEEVPFADTAATAAAADRFPYMGRLAATSVTQSSGAQEFCSTWASGTAADVENEPVDSSIPTLVLAGSYDPITPPEDGAAVAERLPNAHFVEFPSLGHGVSTAGDCPLGITLRFLEDPMAVPDTSCVALMRPPRFAGEAAPVDVALESFEDTTAGVTGVAPDEWNAIGVGTFARGEDALDQTAIVQLAAAGASPSFMAQTVGSQLGLEGSLDPVEMVTVGDRTWDRYEGPVQGYTADIYVTEADGATLLVMLLSEEPERQALITDVVIPALEAIRRS